MAFSDLYKIKNIKISCVILTHDSFPLSLNNDIKKKECNNFVVIRYKYVYTIFKTRCDSNRYHVNITKISCEDEINNSLDQLNAVISNRFSIVSYKVNNYTCVFDFKEIIPLVKIYTELKQEDFVKHVRFNPERFPGMFLSLDKVTLLLFASGKIVIIGAREKQNIENGLRHICFFLNKYKDNELKNLDQSR